MNEIENESLAHKILVRKYKFFDPALIRANIGRNFHVDNHVHVVRNYMLRCLFIKSVVGHYEVNVYRLTLFLFD